MMSQAVKFGMNILKTTKTAFERQILESVLIQKARAHNIMNNKSLYNCCALPRLTAKLGERDMEKWREEDRLEHQQEATIEEKSESGRKIEPRREQRPIGEERSQEEKGQLGTPKAHYELLEREGWSMETKKDRGM